MSTELHQGIFDAALEIAARRAKVLREVKSLLEDDRDSEALKMMKEFLEVKRKPKTSRSKLVEFPRPAPERSK
jgi:hypothetical protein